MNRKMPAAAALAVALAAPGFALGEEAPAPSRSTESYQAWTVECTTISAPQPAKEEKAAEGDKAKPAEPAAATRVCEAAQVYTNRNTGNEIARLVFALDPKDNNKIVAGMRAVVDASFDKSPALTDDDKEIATGRFTRCANSHCFVLFDIDQKKIDALAASKKPGLQYPIASGQMIRIAISTAGLADAVAVLKTKK